MISRGHHVPQMPLLFPPHMLRTCFPAAQDIHLTLWEYMEIHVHSTLANRHIHVHTYHTDQTNKTHVTHRCDKPDACIYVAYNRELDGITYIYTTIHYNSETQFFIGSLIYYDGAGLGAGPFQMVVFLLLLVHLQGQGICTCTCVYRYTYTCF